MRRIGAVGLVLTAVLAASTSASAAEPAGTDYPALVRSLSKVVEENFYDPHMHGADWKAVSSAYEAKARSVRDDAAFRRLASEMMATLHASHTNVTPPGGGAGAIPALRLAGSGSEQLVVEVGELSDARARGLRPGYLVRNADKLGGRLGTDATVDYEDCGGARASAGVRREKAFWPPRQPTFLWSRIKVAPDTAYGYLRVDAFEDDGAELADKAMADLGDTQGLIIDLRNNDGGNASAVRLASYFVGAPGAAVILLDRAYLQKLGHTPTKADALAAVKVERTYTSEKVWNELQANKGAIAIWTEDLGAKRYGKPVVVLIGPDTASAAEGFGWIMKLRSGATFVGQETAGALLSAQNVSFGQGWSVRVPMAGVWAPDGADYGDRAVSPDVTVKLDRASLCAGRDAQLEAALAALQAKGR
jgi:carboxyl-terminal processing protease